MSELSRNICLVVVDSLTAFNLSMYGYGESTSPFLEKAAEEGVKYQFAYSNAPWTFPSHASIFSGKLPVDHRATSETMRFDDESFVEE
jgi:arylsulfatase A-like enzyme